MHSPTQITRPSISHIKLVEVTPVPTCFVIQPFDRGGFDKRYDQVFCPAIRASNLEPYRVDRDPNVTIPIEEIENGIQAAAACIADITLDNPNVWFELGYAIAAKKDVVIVCSDVRVKFPFDVQHRSIIRYTTESPDDFKELSDKIHARLAALLKTRERLVNAADIQSVSKVEGLEQYEVAALIAVAEQVDDPDGGIAVYAVRSAMERAGFNSIAATLGLKALLMKGMLESIQASDYNGEAYTVYKVGDSGMRWLFDNTDKLTLTRHGRPNYETDEPYNPASDNIPF